MIDDLDRYEVQVDDWHLERSLSVDITLVKVASERLIFAFFAIKTKLL